MYECELSFPLCHFLFKFSRFSVKTINPKLDVNNDRNNDSDTKKTLNTKINKHSFVPSNSRETYTTTKGFMRLRFWSICYKSWQKT